MDGLVAKEFFQFVTRTLPNLLSESGDPFEAMEKLREKWEENRTHQIADRSEEVAKGRAEVDAKLESRRAKARKKTSRKPRS